MPVEKMKIAAPYTMPIEATNYTKGSAPWLRTHARELCKTCGHDVFLFGPEYEVFEPEEQRPWRAHPIVFKTPETFSAKLHSGLPVEGTWDVPLPIFGFTRGPNYAVTSEATPSQFRAVVEVTRWYMDLLPALNGFDHWDAIWIQHMSWNMIIGAHYAAQGKAVAISHETCARCDKDNGVGGWAATHLREHVLHAFDNEHGQTPAVAISDQVKWMLTAMPSGMMLTDKKLKVKLPDGTVEERERIPVIRNMYDDSVFHPIPGMTKRKLLDEFYALASNYHKAVDEFTRKKYARYVPFSNVKDDGNWAIFVGRGAEFKGIEQLIRTWAKYIQTNFPEGEAKDTLIVIGPELDSDSRFAAYAEELGVAENMAFVGPQQPADINKLYNAADLAVMISLNEGDGVVVKQPGGAAKRVVAPNSGGPGEYMVDAMGPRVKSRDPERSESMQRGIELLNGDRAIRWGALDLSGADILRHYRVWRDHYEEGTKDPAKLAKFAARNERIEKLASGWEQSDPYVNEVRGYASDYLTAYMNKTSRPDIPSTHDADVDVMVEAFRVMGGMDVEVDDFVDAYGRELSFDDETLRTLRAEAYDYVKSTFAATSHAKKINELLMTAAERPWEKDAHVADQTVYAAYQVHKDTAVAYGNWRLAQKGEDDKALAKAVADFNRQVVVQLNEVAANTSKWPSHMELGLRDPLRSSKIAAQFSGVTVEEYEDLRTGLAERAAASEVLQAELNAAFIANYNTAPGAAAVISAAAAAGLGVK